MASPICYCTINKNSNIEVSPSAVSNTIMVFCIKVPLSNKIYVIFSQM